MSFLLDGKIEKEETPQLPEEEVEEVEEGKRS